MNANVLAKAIELAKLQKLGLDTQTIHQLSEESDLIDAQTLIITRVSKCKKDDTNYLHCIVKPKGHTGLIEANLTVFESQILYDEIIRHFRTNTQKYQVILDEIEAAEKEKDKEIKAELLSELPEKDDIQRLFHEEKEKELKLNVIDDAFDFKTYKYKYSPAEIEIQGNILYKVIINEARYNLVQVGTNQVISDGRIIVAQSGETREEAIQRHREFLDTLNN